MPRESPPNNIDELRQRVEAGWRPEYIFFWSHQPSRPGELGSECFSQWYPAPFVVEGIRYPTAEHYMMASKARLFGDGAVAAEIVAASTPAQAKNLGRGVAGFGEDVWERERFGIVVRASLEKFRQNQVLGTYLLGTDVRVLAEASPSDRIWGIGLGADDERAGNPLRWNGLNLLGFALMSARGTLAELNDEPGRK